MKLPGTGSGSGRGLTRPSALQTARNLRLVAQASIQHLGDDPLLLVLQVSRRLPFKVRVAVGRALQSTSRVSPEIGALGGVLAGRHSAAVEVLSQSSEPASRLRARIAGEAAILVDRQDLIPPKAPAVVHARAAWARGDLSNALSILESAGAGNSRYARRLRSECDLLAPGYRLPLDGLEIPRTDADAPMVQGAFRVLHILTNSLPHTQSGYSLRSHRILGALKEDGIDSVALTRTGYPVMVGIPGAQKEDVVDGVRYVRTLPSALPQTQEERLVIQVQQALRLVEEFRPHVIHTTTNYLNALVARAVSEATGLPWVFEVRGLMEQTWVASHLDDESRKIASTSEKFERIAAREGELAREADAVVTLSRTMAEELERRGVDSSEIVLVPNGVDDSLFADGIDTGEARRRTGLVELEGFGTDAVLIGAVSALVDYEGLDVLLDAVALLIEDETVPEELRARLHVVLAGDGVSRPGLAERAKSLGIESRVHLPGRVPRTEARRWVEALDIVVVPRRDVAVARSVTPQKPIEAMALQRPVIASDLGAIREVMVGASMDEPVSLLVAPGSAEEIAAAILGLWSDPQKVSEIREASLKVAQERTWSQLVRRYGEIYGSVTRAGQGGRRSGE